MALNNSPSDIHSAKYVQAIKIFDIFQNNVEKEILQMDKIHHRVIVIEHLIVSGQNFGTQKSFYAKLIKKQNFFKS